MIQGFTRAQLERALDKAGSAGDTIGAAALQIALHRALPAAHRQVLQEDHDAVLDRLLTSPEDRAEAERAAAGLQSWVRRVED